MNRFPGELSGGQKQRVGLMRALMLDPKLLLMDEPLGALDPIVKSGVKVELKRIFQDLNKTVVLVTHDLKEAEYFGDEIILMDKGSIIQKGSFAELANNPVCEFVQSFFRAYD